MVLIISRIARVRRRHGEARSNLFSDNLPLMVSQIAGVFFGFHTLKSTS